MPKLLPMLALLGLAGCEMPTTREGCRIGVTEIGQAYTQACVAAAREQEARAAGGVVTNCWPDGRGGMSCTTY